MPASPSPPRRRIARLVLAGILSLAGTAALAQEQLLMPYACSAAGGQVTLTPTQRELGHRIYGEREERPYTVCSPINPSICRTWLLHRFDLDCGGARVNWLSVVEAASELTTGRAWIEEGRLYMRMNQYWGRDIGPDDPCPRWRRRGRGGNDDCFDVRPRHPRAVVEMPRGFAPAFGLPVRFARLTPPVQVSEPAAGKARELAPKDPAVKAPQVAGSTHGTPGAATKAPGRPIGTTPADSAQDGAAQAQAKPKRPEPAREAAADPILPSGSVIPKIINRPANDQPQAGDASASKPTAPADGKPAVPRPAEATNATAPESRKAAEGEKRAERPDASSSHSALTAFIPSSTTQAVVGFVGLVAGALGLFAWARRREQMSLAAAGAREIGAVSLDGRGARVHRSATGTAVAAARASTAAAGPVRPPPLPTTAGAASAGSDVEVPRTYEEACRVLGASPDAGEAAIRKIVEGLRQSWHPDLANSEADRRLRERRMMQINVAWEILSGKRPAA